MKAAFRYIILFYILVFFSKNYVLAQKTDTIIHINGNIMTGEIKKMLYGVITWKMDGMGSISFEEIKVNTMISKKRFEIKLKTGDVVYGSLGASTIDRTVNIIEEGKQDLVRIEDIVEIYPIKKSFWIRLSGNFSIGFNYSKGSNVATIVNSGNLEYRLSKNYFYLDWDSNLSFQNDTLSSTKRDVGLYWEHLLKKDGWSSLVGMDLSQNSSLGTKFRIGLAGNILKDIIYNDWNRFNAGAGLAVTQETPYDDSVVSNDLGGIIMVNWKIYRLISPKITLNSNVSFLPYFTDDRYRVNFNLNPQVSIINDDFLIGFSFYYTYDSSPTSENAANVDHGMNLQFTYSLH